MGTEVSIVTSLTRSHLLRRNRVKMFHILISEGVIVLYLPHRGMGPVYLTEFLPVNQTKSGFSFPDDLLTLSAN